MAEAPSMRYISREESLLAASPSAAAGRFCSKLVLVSLQPLSVDISTFLSYSANSQIPETGKLQDSALSASTVQQA